MSANDWKTEGVTFGCTACGACCKGEGFVYLFPDDIDTLMNHLNIGRQELVDTYIMPIEIYFDDEELIPYLVLRKQGDTCVFLQENGLCGIHGGKPRHCVDSPFMPEFLGHDESLELFISICPGWGSGKHYTPQELAPYLEFHDKRQEAYEDALEKVNYDLEKLFGVTLPPPPWPIIEGELAGDDPDAS